MLSIYQRMETYCFLFVFLFISPYTLGTTLPPSTLFLALVLRSDAAAVPRTSRLLLPNQKQKYHT